MIFAAQTSVPQICVWTAVFNSTFLFLCHERNLSLITNLKVPLGHHPFPHQTWCSVGQVGASPRGVLPRHQKKSRVPSVPSQSLTIRPEELPKPNRKGSVFLSHHFPGVMLNFRGVVSRCFWANKKTTSAKGHLEIFVFFFRIREFVSRQNHLI